MPFPVFKYRFPDRRCVSRVRLFFPPEAEEAEANELLTGKREGLVPGARVLIISSAMFLEWAKYSDRRC
ncbi:MAG TPA: hypothetical protein DD422_00610 [Akkermansia sp.]|nr:hypothetical protein [Akkermansia sp.]HBN16533.1 hypothetical protein [Akkermansia sp.]